MKTAIRELISEFEAIKKTCNTVQETFFFDGVLAIIESKYLDKEKQIIINAFNQGYREGENSQHVSHKSDVSQFADADIYYNQNFEK